MEVERKSKIEDFFVNPNKSANFAGDKIIFIRLMY